MKCSCSLRYIYCVLYIKKLWIYFYDILESNAISKLFEIYDLISYLGPVYPLPVKISLKVTIAVRFQPFLTLNLMWLSHIFEYSRWHTLYLKINIIISGLEVSMKYRPWLNKKFD